MLLKSVQDCSDTLGGTNQCLQVIIAAAYWMVVYLALTTILRVRYCYSYFTGEKTEVH